MIMLADIGFHAFVAGVAEMRILGNDILITTGSVSFGLQIINPKMMGINNLGL